MGRREGTEAGRPGRWLWWAGAALFVLAEHTGWNSPAAAWLFAPLLLRYARLRPARRGLLRVGAAVLLGTGVWLGSTGLLFVPALLPRFLLLAAVQTLPFAADRLLASRRPGAAGTLVYPVVLAAGELLFTKAARLGDYGLLGHTQTGNLPLLQLASVTGMYGVGFAVAWSGSVAHWAWGRGFRWREVRRGVLVWAAVLAAVVGGGAARLALDGPPERTVRVAGVSPSRAAEDASKRELQAAVPRWWDAHAVARADAARVRAALEPQVRDVLAATEREARGGARIVVWPETQVSAGVGGEPRLLRRVADVARAQRVYVAAAYQLYTGRAPYVRNISALVGPDGRTVWHYDKAHPTPMERERPGPGRVPAADTPYGRVAAMICYDLDFPGLARQAADRGAGLLLVPANDWRGYGTLHAERARARAVEYGYSIVRQAEHGVATAVDAQGRTAAAADWSRSGRQTLVTEVPVHPRVRTVYGAVGDVFGWLCVAAAAALAAAGALLRRRQPGPTRDFEASRPSVKQTR